MHGYGSDHSIIIIIISLSHKISHYSFQVDGSSQQTNTSATQRTTISTEYENVSATVFDSSKRKKKEWQGTTKSKHIHRHKQGREKSDIERLKAINR